MRKAKWLLMFLLALSMAAPTFAVELTLGGFPSYMRTRARYFGNATFVSALSVNNAKELGFSDNDGNIFFADTTLRLTPQLVLSDSVTIRAQLNVFDNNIWGGATSNLFGGANGSQNIINSSLSFSDRFRGALLTGPQAIDDPGFFDVRMLHADIYQGWTPAIRLGYRYTCKRRLGSLFRPRFRARQVPVFEIFRGWSRFVNIRVRNGQIYAG